MDSKQPLIATETRLENEAPLEEKPSVADIGTSELESEDRKLLTTDEQQKLRQLQRQDSRFSILAWIFVGIGLVFFFHGLFEYFVSGSLGGFNVLGDYIGGTAGALWALAGLFFIYVAFLGQKEQLIYQRAELRATRREFEQQRKELAFQGKELAGQRKQLELQNEQFERQFRLAIYPRFHLELHEWGGYASDERKHMEIRILNNGEEAASDLEYFFFGSDYRQEVVGDPRDPDDVFPRTDCKLVGYGTVSLFGRSRKYRVAFPFEEYPDDFSFVMQFRDMTGANYIEVYVFEGREQKHIEQKVWYLTDKNPKTVQSHPRLRLIVKTTDIEEGIVVLNPHVRVVLPEDNACPDYISSEMVEEIERYTSWYFIDHLPKERKEVWEE